MKPYNLEWWLEIMELVSDRMEYHQQGYRKHRGTNLGPLWKSKYKNDAELYSWVYNRIITKYGE